MRCNMSLLLRPSSVGVVIIQSLYVVFLDMAHLVIRVASDVLSTYGCIFIVALTFLIFPFSFVLAIGCKCPFQSLYLIDATTLFLPPILL